MLETCHVSRSSSSYKAGLLHTSLLSLLLLGCLPTCYNLFVLGVKVPLDS